MGQLTPVVFNKQLANHELVAFETLLNKEGKGELGEANDILPFFSKNQQLCALMGMYNPMIVNYQNLSIAREFCIFGDHVADLVIGDFSKKQFCFVEFEDAKATSIFKKSKKKASVWSDRYHNGFSQLIDWILWIENNQGKIAYKQRFKSDAIAYNLLLVIGRDRDLADLELRERFNWRKDSVVVASKKVHCITYDELHMDLVARMQLLNC